MQISTDAAGKFPESEFAEASFPIFARGMLVHPDFFPWLRYLSLSLTVILPLIVGGCQSPNDSKRITQEFRTAITSTIPGARATVLPGGDNGQSNRAQTEFCVTDAGYCPLASAVEAGRNCLCETNSFSYGGKTGVPPKPYQDQ